MRVFFRLTITVAWIFFAFIIVGGIVFYASGTSVYAPKATKAQETSRNVARHLELSGNSSKIRPTRSVMLFTGDVMLGRHVERLINAHGADYPFEHISAFLQRPDFTFVNLEGPIVYDHYPTPDYSTSFSFSEDKAGVLAKHGVDAVALGNNHTLDRGHAGYEDTTAILASREILYTGHATEMGPEYVLSHTVGEEPIQFLSFNVTFPFNDEDAAVETVRQVAESTGDPVFVNVHWGSEYQLTSTNSQKELGRRLIDAGADVIIGHHPHVTQEIELYNGKLIFYSLGNFIFDQYFSVDVQESYAMSVIIEGEEMRFRIHPLQSTNSQVRLMEHEYMADWLGRLADRSSPELTDAIKSRTIIIGGE